MGRAGLQTAAAVLLVLAVLFIISIATEVLIADQIRPRNEIGYIFLTVLLGGLGGGALLEAMGARIFA